jgi:hypothetical protein
MLDISSMQGYPLLCDSCLAGEQRRQPFPKAAKYRAGNVLELVHGDLCRPIALAMHGGRRYSWTTAAATCGCSS